MRNAYALMLIHSNWKMTDSKSVKTEDDKLSTVGGGWRIWGQSKAWLHCILPPVIKNAKKGEFRSETVKVIANLSLKGPEGEEKAVEFWKLLISLFVVSGCGRFFKGESRWRVHRLINKSKTPML
jgi:hypothetical protein